VLFNDPDPRCRKEAADELGDLHHTYSLEALAKALQDKDPGVRKEAIEGLKKIKEHTKEKEHKKGKPEERGIKDDSEEQGF
jgi:HEAT repeat protein